MTKKKYIKFEVIQEKAKTKVYAVTNINTGLLLGTIHWYGAWRQYVLAPSCSLDTIWNTGCLQDVIDFINELMKVRKNNGR